MSPSLNKTNKQIRTLTNNDKALINHKWFEVCHAHNMKKKIKRGLSSYLKRSRVDLSS